MYNAGGASTNKKVLKEKHTPRLRRTPMKRGRAEAARGMQHGRMWLRVARPLFRGVGVCITLAEPAQINKVLVNKTYPPATPYPSEEGTRGGGAWYAAWMHLVASSTSPL